MQFQRAACAGQGIVQAVGEFVGAGPLDAWPGPLRSNFFGTIYPTLRSVEIAKPRRHESIQRQPIGMKIGRGIGPIRMTTEEFPGGEWAKPFETIAGMVVNRFRIAWSRAIYGKMEAAAEDGAPSCIARRPPINRAAEPVQLRNGPNPAAIS